jgi:putative phage-type endonuclease
MEQRTDEWFAARCGKVTASRVSDIIAKTKSGYSTSRANYMAELLCERLTGKVGDSFKNAAMEWGINTEPQAIAAYEASEGVLVERVGFVSHSLIPMAGASPDGLVGDDGLVEIKCPNTATHIETLLGSSIPSKYVAQMQWQMACTDRQWCDFVSFDPRMPEHMQMFCKRLTRDPAYINMLLEEITKFLSELDNQIIQLNSLYGV